MLMASIQPVKRLKLTYSVATELEGLIMRGEYTPGEKLPPERLLADSFGVGRSSMREAIRIVEAEGLVRSEHGVGVFVVRSQKQESASPQWLAIEDLTLFDLLEVRLALERDSAALAARRIDASVVEELQGLIRAMADEQLTSEQEFAQLDAQLHCTIARATKNPLMLRLTETIEPLCVTYSQRVIGLPGRRQLAQMGHKTIVSALAKGKSREASTAAVQHIRDVQEDIAAHFDQSQSRHDHEVGRQSAS